MSFVVGVLVEGQLVQEWNVRAWEERAQAVREAKAAREFGRRVGEHVLAETKVFQLVHCPFMDGEGEA